MSNHPLAEERSRVQSTHDASAGAHTETSGSHGHTSGCGMHHRGFKGLWMMAVCCGAPLVILLTLPVLGAVLGKFGLSILTVLALLACPVGMSLMLWIMMRSPSMEAESQTQVRPASWLRSRLQNLLSHIK